MGIMDLVLRTNGVTNMTHIFMFVMLMWLSIMCAPRVGFMITKDYSASTFLCLCPLMVFGIMAYCSFHVFGLSSEVVYFTIAGIGNSIVSLTFHRKFLRRRDSVLEMLRENGLLDDEDE